MDAAIVLLVCAVAAVEAQVIGPMSGMGGSWGSPLWHSGMRYPGMMQSSQLNTVSYPTWRSHPLFKMLSGMSEKSVGSDVVNVPKVPSAQEVLTHMALVSPNPKPYLDTISDFFYEPQKARTVLTPVASVAPMASVASVAPVATVASVAPVSPMYMQGMNVMRASSNVGDDCGPQDGTRWERGLDWLY